MEYGFDLSGLQEKEREAFRELAGILGVKEAGAQEGGIALRFGQGRCLSARKTGDFEIVSLTGTVNTMDGAYYAHIHMSAGDREYHVFGGHLNRAVVSGTCDMVIQVIDGTVDRIRDEEVGLNVYRF